MSDEAYRAWIQREPSCLSGKFSEYVDGEGRNLACHVRRAATSGTGYKGEFSCVPMTNAEHQWQHQKGEFSCLAKFLPGFNGTPQDAKKWFDYQVNIHLQKWKAHDDPSQR